MMAERQSKGGEEAAESKKMRQGKSRTESTQEGNEQLHQSGTAS